MAHLKAAWLLGGDTGSVLTHRRLLLHAMMGGVHAFRWPPRICTGCVLNMDSASPPARQPAGPPYLTPSIPPPISPSRSCSVLFEGGDGDVSRSSSAWDARPAARSGVSPEGQGYRKGQRKTERATRSSLEDVRYSVALLAARFRGVCVVVHDMDRHAASVFLPRIHSKCVCMFGDEFVSFKDPAP